MHADGPQHVVAAAVELPGLAPADQPGMQGPRTVLFLDAFQFAVEEVERLIPGHADKAVVAALRGIALFALLEPVQPHHRVADARRAVDQADDAVDHFRRVLVKLEGLDLDHLAAADTCADGAPVRAGQFPFRPGRGGSCACTGAGGRGCLAFAGQEPARSHQGDCRSHRQPF